MAEAYYEPTPATDGASMNPVPGAVFQVFEISDTTFSTPLSLRVGAGNPTTTVAASDTLATLPGVYVTSPNFEHHWVSGSFVWRRDSIDGAKKSIEAAKAAAVDVQNRAENGEFKGAKGDQGDPGRDGANVLPTDQAITEALTTPGSPANTALSATIAEVAPDVVPTLAHYDTFNRADGDPGVAPSGQTYMIYKTNNQLPKIAGKELVSAAQGAGSTGSGYIGINFPDIPSKFVQRFKLHGPTGTGGSSATVVWGGRADGADSTIYEIIQRCVHLLIETDGISLQYRDAATYPNGNYPSTRLANFTLPNGTDEVFEWTITRTAPDTIEIITPLGAKITKTDPEIARLAGRSVYWQAVNQQTTGGNESRLTGLWTYMGPVGSLPSIEAAPEYPRPARKVSEIRHFALNNSALTELNVIDRAVTIGSSGLAAGRLHLTYFTPEKDVLAKTITYGAGATPVAGATLIQYGLFKAAADGSLTLVAKTADGTATGLATTDTVTEKGLAADGGYPTQYGLRAGERYAVGILTVGQTQGTCKASVVDNTLANFVPPRLCGSVNGLTAMPTTVASGSVSANTVRPWARIR